MRRRSYKAGIKNSFLKGDMSWHSARVVMELEGARNVMIKAGGPECLASLFALSVAAQITAPFVRLRVEPR